MKPRFLKLFLLISMPAALHAQTKQVEKLQQLWFGYLFQPRLSNKLGLWAEVQLRTKDDFFNDFSQSITGVGLTYFFNEDAKLTATYSYVNNFPAEGHSNVSQPEHRLWQQFQWYTRYNKMKLMQWIRLEERWKRNVLNDYELADSYTFNFRTRYNLFSQFALSKKKFQPHTLSLIVSDEVMINFGKQIVNNYFDQNRFFVGLGYAVNKHDNFAIGYLNAFQQLPTSGEYRRVDAIRMTYFHNVDFRKHGQETK